MKRFFDKVEKRNKDLMSMFEGLIGCYAGLRFDTEHLHNELRNGGEILDSTGSNRQAIVGVMP
jgi:hypothetical protein